jgi:hypothetical protein
MMDGAVIGLTTLATKVFALILGVVAAIFSARVGFWECPWSRDRDVRSGEGRRLGGGPVRRPHD